LPGGAVLVEIGAGQAGDVLALAAGAGLVECATRTDLAGIARVVVARAPGF
jgi:release factor glutamine methyltransferase